MKAKKLHLQFDQFEGLHRINDVGKNLLVQIDRASLNNILMDHSRMIQWLLDQDIPVEHGSQFSPPPERGE